MRNKLGPKKVKRLAIKTGLPVKQALTRGGTDHRIDLLLEGGAVVHLYKDGEMEKSDIGWLDPDNND